MYPYVDVNSVLEDCVPRISEGCSSALKSIIVIPKGRTQCPYSIGELRKKLREAGYPGDIVDRCILEFLDDQYISL